MLATWDAVDYAAHSAGQYRWALGHLERLALAGHERVLDLGCGDGKVTASLAARLPRGQVVGVDKSPDMIALARGGRSGARRNLSFAVADAQDLPFDREFDFVFSNSALHWVPRHRDVLAGMARGLREGGRVFLSMGGRGTAPAVLAALDDLNSRGPWAGAFTGVKGHFFFGPPEYEAWLPEAGFLPLRVELVRKPLRQAGRVGLIGWLRTTWMPYSERIPPAERADFLEELTSRVEVACSLGPDGSILLEMVNLEVEAILR